MHRPEPLQFHAGIFDPVTVNSGDTLQLDGTSLDVGGLSGSGSVANNSATPVT